MEKSGTAIPVSIGRSILGSETETVNEIVRQILKWLDREWRTTETESVGGGLKFPFTGTEAGQARSVLPQRPSFSALRHAFPPERWERPVALLVDEIQNVDLSALDVLEALHLATYGLPVVPVYAGLGNSEWKLDDILSRLEPENVHDIDRLPPEDVHRAFGMMMKEFRIDMHGADPLEWKAWLVEMSDGWPQHMHNAMRALAVGLGKTGGKLSGVNAGRVHEDAVERKELSYSKRISRDISNAGFLISGLITELKRNREGISEGELIDHILENERPSNGWKLPKHGDAETFLDHLVRRGILQKRSGENPRNLHHCPIPTLQDYILKEWPIGVTALEPPRKALPPERPAISAAVTTEPAEARTDGVTADITENESCGDRPHRKVRT